MDASGQRSAGHLRSSRQSVARRPADWTDEPVARAVTAAWKEIQQSWQKVSVGWRVGLAGPGSGAPLREQSLAHAVRGGTGRVLHRLPGCAGTGDQQASEQRRRPRPGRSCRSIGRSHTTGGGSGDPCPTSSGSTRCPESKPSISRRSSVSRKVIRARLGTEARVAPLVGVVGQLSDRGGDLRHPGVYGMPGRPAGDRGRSIRARAEFLVDRAQQYRRGLGGSVSVQGLGIGRDRYRVCDGFNCWSSGS